MTRFVVYKIILYPDWLDYTAHISHVVILDNARWRLVKLANQNKDFINYESCHETGTWFEIKSIYVCSTLIAFTPCALIAKLKTCVLCFCAI